MLQSGVSQHAVPRRVLQQQSGFEVSGGEGAPWSQLQVDIATAWNLAQCSCRWLGNDPHVKSHAREAFHLGREGERKEERMETDISDC